MTERRYMVFRKVAVVTVPATMWRELRGWKYFPRMCAFGLTHAEAIRLIEWNQRHFEVPGTQYFLQPIDDFLADELQPSG